MRKIQHQRVSRFVLTTIRVGVRGISVEVVAIIFPIYSSLHPLAGPYLSRAVVDHFQVIYNKPVNVSGTPRLAFMLDSANDTTTSYAYYDDSFNIGRCDGAL